MDTDEKKYKELRDALVQVQLECIHYLNTGRGEQFLKQALNKAQHALDGTTATLGPFRDGA